MKAAARKQPNERHRAEMAGKTCVCKGRKHSQDCGCLKAAHVLKAKLMNFTNGVRAGTKPEVYAAFCEALAGYLTGDPSEAIRLEMIPAKRCRCGKCPRYKCQCGECPAGIVDCFGIPVEPHCPPGGPAPVDYECENPVTCELHAWEVKMACSVLADSANEMIDTETGKGDSSHRLRSHSHPPPPCLFCLDNHS